MSDKQFEQMWFWFLSIWILLVYLCVVTTCKSAPMPAHVQYVIKHYGATDRYGNAVGYDMKVFAKAVSEFGEFKIPCGYDGEPNTVMAECFELQRHWNQAKLLQFTMGKLSLQDINEVAVNWVSK